MTETPDPETSAPDARAPQPVRTVDEWAQRGVHRNVYLPSGAQVDLRLPNIQQMIATGDVPNPLVESALKQRSAQKIDVETIRETWDFTRFIIPVALVSPTLEAPDVERLPAEDVILLTQLINRVEDTDAAGFHLGGLDTVKRFRESRGLLSLDEIFPGDAGSGTTDPGVE